MPTYEYLCDKCGLEFEKFQSMSDKPLTICPKELCSLKKWGKGKVRKLISSGAGLLFKGSGFYITDYRSENYKTGAKKESGAKESGAKDAGAKESGAKESGGKATKESSTTSGSGESKAPSGGDRKPAAKPDTKPAKSAT